jgi:hypothetical protein
MLVISVLLLAILPWLPQPQNALFDVKIALAARQSALHHHEDPIYAMTKGYA